MCLTFVLLIFVGYGEARRTTYTYRIETTILQSDTFIDIIDPFIEAGFPLTMYSGYNSIADVFLESNRDISVFIVKDHNGQIVYTKSRFDDPIDQEFSIAKINLVDTNNVLLKESLDMFSIERSLPENRDGNSGSIEILLSKDISENYLNNEFDYIFKALIIASLLLAIVFYISTSDKKIFEPITKRLKDSFIKVFYLVLFITLGVLVTFTTVEVNYIGVRGKADAIGTLLARRLSPVIELGLEFKDLKDVDTILVDFKNRYDMIDSVSLITSEMGGSNVEDQHDYILYDSNPVQIGQEFSPDLKRHLVFDAPLYFTKGDTVKNRLLIKIKVPRREINMAVLNSLINFSALIIGCGLIAMLFLNVGLAIAATLRRRHEISDSALNTEESLQLIKAAYFLVVFISAMAVPFFPLLVSELNSGKISSLPFMIYYLTFAGVLIPSGNMSGKGRIKETMAIGFISELIAGLLIAFSTSLPLLTIGRAMGGVGQGFFLIGFQSYVISVTPPEKRTQGAAIKVIARNSALIAGTAIGALLYVFMGYRNLFILSSAISILGFLYLILMVPRTTQKFGTSSKKLELKNISYVFKDAGFIKVLLLTGIPAKMGITGVVNFAVPLLMGVMGYTPESIGRYLMLFFIVSMFTTKIASKHTDKTGNTTGILFLSALMGGLGMLALGLQEVILGYNSSVVTIMGLFVIGIGNGLISAPIITQITKTKSSQKVGHGPMIAVYTFLERFGHILGPGVVSALIAVSNNRTAIGIALFGAITLFLGLLFPAITRKKDFNQIA